MAASASPLSGNRHHYASGLVLEPQWTCDCKAWPVCYTVRGPPSGCFRTSCADTGPNTSSHTHTPPSTSTAGCTDRLHEYLSEQVIMSTHIRLAFFFSSPLPNSHESQVWQRFHYPADLAAHQYAAQWPPPCGLVTSPGQQGLAFSKCCHGLRNVYNIVICCPPLNRFQIEDISSLRISAGVPFFCQPSCEQNNINVSSKHALGRASHCSRFHNLSNQIHHTHFYCPHAQHTILGGNASRPVWIYYCESGRCCDWTEVLFSHTWSLFVHV